MGGDNQKDNIDEPKTNNKFLTPDQTAARDTFNEPEKPGQTISDYQPVIVSDHSKRAKKRRLNLTKKQILLFSAGGLVIVLLALTGFFLLTSKPAPKVIVKNTEHKVKKPAVASGLVPSDLTGLPVQPSVNNTPVTAVMIENSLFARPQSGLGAAGVVFEALTEGGISRFMALFQDTSPPSVGPVRSVRPYFLQWALGFNAAIAHVGGSPQALSDIKPWGVRNLDEFYYGSYYHRISSRQAPHNMYTSLADLHSLEKNLGYSVSPFTAWKRQSPPTTLQAPSAGSINLYLSGPSYNVNYTYSPKNNDYLRDEGGAPQIDANTNTQIAPKVVIAMVVPWSTGPTDAQGAAYSVYQTIGSGTAYVFQNGQEQTVTWTKKSNNSQILFTDSSGHQVPLDAGQVWITAISSSSNINYSK